MIVPQGLLKGSFLYLIYINYLPQGLLADVKLSAGDISLFPVVDDIDESASKLNDDLVRIHY